MTIPPDRNLKIYWAHQAKLAYLSLLKKMNYEIEVRHDMGFLADWMRSAGGHANVGFCPERMNLHPGNAFWIAVRQPRREADKANVDPHGIACVIACRLLETDDYIKLIEDGLLWFKEPQPEKTHICAAVRNIKISGKIAHDASLFVPDRHRARGMPVLLPRLTRSITMSNPWRPDYHAGMIRQDPVPAKRLAWKYGYECEVPIVRGASSARSDYVATNMTIISARSMLRQFKRDCSWLELHDGENVRDLVFGVRERTKKPHVDLRGVVVEKFNDRIDRAASGADMVQMQRMGT